ncbi:MAG: hypothetical protein IJP92_11340, partial [Lachnospiraceae bacterium]|nr:hypothetical protein [Lachnospiraceae bacterium]
YRFGDPREQQPEHYRRTAIHEAGHAYIAALSGHPPTYVTIVSRADFGGYVQPDTREGDGTRTEEDLRMHLCMLLAGRVAEQVLLDEVTGVNTGAASDLQQASHLAMQMVTSYGMKEGWLYAFPDRESETEVFDAVQEANRLLTEEYAHCRQLITEGRDKVLALAERLMEKNHLLADTIREILG